MPADLASFRAQFPEFASVPDASVESLLVDAEQVHAANPRATLYCAAHLAALAADGAGVATADQGSGEVRLEMIGSQRLDYLPQAEKGREAFFTRTPYGRMMLVLEQRTPSVAMAARFH